MSTMIQIRNVPDEVHREVKSRAAKAGMSLSDYLLREVERLVKLPTMDEIEERLAALPPVAGEFDVVAEIQAVRQERDEQLEARLRLGDPGATPRGDTPARGDAR